MDLDTRRGARHRHGSPPTRGPALANAQLSRQLVRALACVRGKGGDERCAEAKRREYEVLFGFASVQPAAFEHREQVSERLQHPSMLQVRDSAAAWPKSPAATLQQSVTV